MSKKLLYSIIVVLIITNVASLVFWKNDDTDENTNLDDVGGEDIVKTKDDHVASIADKKITYQEWMKSLRDTHGESHLKDMIDKAVVQELAEQKDFLISNKVIDREIAFLTTMNGIVHENEISEQENEWREQLRYRYQLEALLTENTPIPEEEVLTHYEKYRNQYDFSTSFQLSHIIVNDMAMADKVISELEQGASFNLLAKEYSLDEETQENGGYLGYFTEGSQFIPYGYEEKVNNMEEHSYSEPISLGNEVVIIYLHRYLSEVKFTFDELKEHIARELAYEQINHHEALRDLWDKLDVEWVYEE